MILNTVLILVSWCINITSRASWYRPATTFKPDGWSCLSFVCHCFYFLTQTICSVAEERPREEPAEEFPIHRRKKEKRQNEPVLVALAGHVNVSQKDSLVSSVGPGKRILNVWIKWTLGEYLDLGQQQTMNSWRCRWSDVMKGSSV